VKFWQSRNWNAESVLRSLNDPEVRERAAQRARRAWRELAVLAAVVGGVLVVYSYRVQLFGVDTPVRILVGGSLVILGWAVARAAARAAEPALSRRNIELAGPAGFLLRLLTLGIALVVALRIVGLDPRTLAAGSAVTAIILGLAAQQTLGNLFAGIVLLSARPFQVMDRVRFQSGGVGGQVEGLVAGQGLLYTTLTSGDDRILVPNSVVLNSAVVPLREPAGIDVRARLRPGTRPTDVQSLLDESVQTPVRARPHIAVEELDGDVIVVRVRLSPAADRDGPQLADEVLAVLSQVAPDVSRESAHAARAE
jgi:small conductance mechanosensitive channel